MQKKLEQRISLVASWANSTLTCVTSAAHLLTAGDTPKVVLETYGTTTESPISVVNSTTFTIASFPKVVYPLGGTLIKDFFSTGQTGLFAFKLGVTPSIQSFVTGTGGATYELLLSLDGVHWVSDIVVDHSTADGDTKFQVITPDWVFAAINIISIGSNTKLSVIYFD